VATDNGNKSYDCYISESEYAYPKIFTLSRNPQLEVGDKVRILYEDGIKELPIILPPTQVVTPPTDEILAGKIFVLFEDFYNLTHIAVYDASGNWVIQFGVENNTTCYDTGNVIAVDDDGYSYINYNTSIVKLNNKSPYNVLVTKSVNGCEAITIGADGYLYAREWFGRNVITKRNLSDLETAAPHIEITNGSLYGLTIDVNGYLYFCNSSNEEMEKWTYQNGGQVTTHAITHNSAYDAGLCVVGNLIGMAAGYRDGVFQYGAYSMDKDLNHDEVEFDIDCSYIHETPASANSNFYFAGDDWTDTNLTLKKYNSSKNLVWSVDVTEVDSLSIDSAAVAAYPF
jgi:hypothetical protein